VVQPCKAFVTALVPFHWCCGRRRYLPVLYVTVYHSQRHASKTRWNAQYTPYRKYWWRANSRLFYRLFTSPTRTRQDCFVLSVSAVWTQDKTRQDIYVNFQVFSSLQYIWDNSCKLESGSRQDKTEIGNWVETTQNCLVLSAMCSHRRHEQEKTRQFRLVCVGGVNTLLQSTSLLPALVAITTLSSAYITRIYIIFYVKYRAVVHMHQINSNIRCSKVFYTIYGLNTRHEEVDCSGNRRRTFHSTEQTRRPSTDHRFAWDWGPTNVFVRIYWQESIVYTIYDKPVNWCDAFLEPPCRLVAFG